MRQSDIPMPRLLPGEKIVYIKKFKAEDVKEIPSSIRQLEYLAGAKNADEFGKSGPVMASAPLPIHADNPEFRLYEVIYGRDSLRVAMDLMDSHPDLAHITLVTLARLQGVSVNQSREEEPGRIIHEDRDPKKDKIARALTAERGWGWPYYGSVDSTPEYIRTFSSYVKTLKNPYKFLDQTFTGRDNERHTMADSFIAALNWVTNRLDKNHDGLLEYKRAIPLGLENQVWRDSWDSYFHSDGTIANHKAGIASIEVQSAVYDSLLEADNIYERYLRRSKEAEELRNRAVKLKSQILKNFWTNKKGGFFVIGTDRHDNGQLCQLDIRTSNMGHLLHSQLLFDPSPDVVEKRESIIKQVFSPEMVGINGIMTLASDEYRYRPGSYHNGSVWAWDNFFIAQGLAMHGYFGLSDYVEQVLLDAIKYARRYAECLRGGDDPEQRINTRIVDVWDDINKQKNRIEQPPQDMQAWTAAAVLEINLSRKRRKVSRLATDKRKRALEHQILSSFAL